MDTNSLSAFLAVAKCGSFSLAAEQLHLTQPAISKRISTLETQLDCRLFDRFGRQITLTEAGKTLLPKAQHILEEITECRRELANLSDEVSGCLALATSHHIGLHRLPPLLRLFTEKYPKVQLDIQFLDSEKAHETVVVGNLELAVITLSPLSRPPLISQPLWRDDLFFVAAADHPLAQLESVPLSTLSEYQSVFPGSHTFTHEIVRQLFEHHQTSFQVALYSNYLETIRMLAGIGRYWSVLPDMMIESPLVKLPVPEHEGLHRMLGYTYHQSRSLSRAARAFIGILEGTPQALHGLI